MSDATIFGIGLAVFAACLGATVLATIGTSAESPMESNDEPDAARASGMHAHGEDS